MSARDLIAIGIKGGRPYRYFETAESILSALTASGYRILGPDELDAVTVEKCAEVAETEGVHPHLNQFAEWYVHAKRIATAIRALCATHQGARSE